MQTRDLFHLLGDFLHTDLPHVGRHLLLLLRGQVQEQLYQVPIHKAATLTALPLVCKRAPRRVVQAPYPLDHLPQRVLQLMEEVKQRLRQCGQEADGAVHAAVQQGGHRGDVAVRQLHDEGAVAEAVDELPHMVLANHVQPVPLLVGCRVAILAHHIQVIARVCREVSVIVQHGHSSGPAAVEVLRPHLQRALLRLVHEEAHAAHHVAHHDEVTPGCKVQRDDVAQHAALNVELPRSIVP
mmetsp:Transcript_4499/g.9681  ORF Transcript_4499/g.9681 Transcript_4499/m.9681 type:complete len:240 (-) Transcript_4499:1011-1730(-)